MDHGRENSNIKVTDWVKYLTNNNVGEIIINSVDNRLEIRGRDSFGISIQLIMEDDKRLDHLIPDGQVDKYKCFRKKPN